MISERETAPDLGRRLGPPLGPRASRAQKPGYVQGEISVMGVAVIDWLAGFRAFARGTRAVPGGRLLGQSSLRGGRKGGCRPPSALERTRFARVEHQEFSDL